MHHLYSRDICLFVFNKYFSKFLRSSLDLDKTCLHSAWQVHVMHDGPDTGALMSTQVGSKLHLPSVPPYFDNEAYDCGKCYSREGRKQPSPGDGAIDPVTLACTEQPHVHWVYRHQQTHNAFEHAV